MPAAYVGAAAAVGSLATNIASATSGGPNVPMPFQPGNQVAQDVSFNNILNNLSNYTGTLPGQVIPQFQQAQHNISNNPYAGLAQQGAGQAAGNVPAVSGYQLGGAGALYGAGNQILGQAFDPQQALYNRTQQQVADQINAANAASGLYGPAAAGVAQQGLTNFNIDWQNALLQRQLAGITGAGRAFGGASDLGNAGINTLASGNALPYSTFLGQQHDIIGGLNSLNAGSLGAFALPQQQLQDIESYLGLGQSANALAQAGQAQGFNESAALGSGITNSLLSLGNNSAVQSGLSQLFGPSSAYSNYNSLYGTTYTGSAADNYGYPGFDFSQAG